MKSKTTTPLFSKLGVFTGILLFLATASPARAAIILINPGSLGSQSSGLTLDITSAFTGAFGTTLAGQSVPLELRFSDNKYLVPPGVGFNTELLVEYTGSSSSPTLNNTFLFDQVGNSLVTPDSTISGDAGGLMYVSGGYLPPTTESFHGVYFDLTLPNTGNTVNEVRIFFQSYNSGVPFTVGVVPEPSIGALFLIACLGGAFVRRRK